MTKKTYRLTAKQFIDAYAELPNPMKYINHPAEHYLYRVNIIDLNGYIKGTMVVSTGAMAELSPSITLEFRLNRHGKALPYWEPLDNIQIIAAE